MTIPLRSCPILLLASTALLLPSVSAAQDAAKAAKTEAIQIAPRDQASPADAPRRSVFIDSAAPAPRPRASTPETESRQIPAPARGGMEPVQISVAGDTAQRIPQLSKAELDATLAQLSAAERRVLFQAIEGSDICDNPPAVAAVLALCRSRIETRSSEFGAGTDKPVSAEERLLRGDIERDGMPSVEAVISRLSRVSTTSSSDDFSNQAIASVALTPPNGTGRPGPDEEKTNLTPETNALINAIVQQLGGQSGGGQP